MEQSEIFRGHLDECFRHLDAMLSSQSPKGSRGAGQSKKPVADFCGVTVASISRWQRGAGSVPIGEPLFKLMCYLEMVGYRVIELERLQKVRRNFVELIGFGLLSTKQAAQLVGYSSASTLSQVLQGHGGTSEDKDQKMWEVWKGRKEELEQKKEESRQRYRLNIPPAARPRVAKSRPTVAPPIIPTSSRRMAIVSLMEGLLVLLKEGSLENLSASELADLQQSADTVLGLSAHLNTLSSQLLMARQPKGGR